MALETSAGIIIYRKTMDGPRFLILYHGRGYWNFPKGKIESEERTFQTALREIREETGITRNELKFQEHFKAFERFAFWRNEEKIHKTITFYLAETKRKAIKISEEQEGQPHEGFAWFTYKEAMKLLNKHKDSMRVLKQAYDFLEKKRQPQPAVRQQQQIARQSTVQNYGPKIIHRPHYKHRINYGNRNNVQRKSFQSGQKNSQRQNSDI